MLTIITVRQDFHGSHMFDSTTPVEVPKESSRDEELPRKETQWPVVSGRKRVMDKLRNRMIVFWAIRLGQVQAKSAKPRLGNQ